MKPEIAKKYVKKTTVSYGSDYKVVLQQTQDDLTVRLLLAGEYADVEKFYEKFNKQDRANLNAIYDLVYSIVANLPEIADKPTEPAAVESGCVICGHSKDRHYPREKSTKHPCWSRETSDGKICKCMEYRPTTPAPTPPQPPELDKCSCGHVRVVHDWGGDRVLCGYQNCSCEVFEIKE